jgi:hypothetical protein
LYSNQDHTKHPGESFNTMDNALPSYVQATTQDHWSIISPYVRSQDLCSATLVSKQWNSIFTPHLWGNPASHFGTENDAVYIALVRFKRSLSWARLSTRSLTHTLRMPPAQAELYDGPRAEWLGDILSRLPRLQSLIVYVFVSLPSGFGLSRLKVI